MALAIIALSNCSSDFTTLVKPLISWDRITPEFPLAPLKDPEDMALLNVSILISESPTTSLAADMIVSVILVPVSPSGTGKTFNSLIRACFDSNAFAPARNILDSVRASIVLISNLIFLLIAFTGSD